MSLSIVHSIFIVIIVVKAVNMNKDTSVNSNAIPRNTCHRDHLMMQYDYPFRDFPYFVSIFSSISSGSNSYKFICSGSLISYYWALTAASCRKTSDSNDTSYLIYAGIVPDPIVIVNEYPGEYLRGQWRIVSGWLIHPNYTNKVANDIALLQIEIPLSVNAYVRVTYPLAYALLKTCDVALRFKSCQVPVYENKTLLSNNKLLFLTVYIIKLEECKTIFSKKQITIGDTHICSVDSAELGSKGCLGSLGSPLICENKQVGIMLDVINCNDTKYGLYTRVDLYQQWIETYVTSGLRYDAIKPSQAVKCSKNEPKRSRRPKSKGVMVLFLFSSYVYSPALLLTFAIL